MRVRGKVVVVTGGASGIGAALARRFSAEGAAHVAIADLDEAGARATATAVNGSHHLVDVANEEAVRELVAAVERDSGPIDLFCSNAGVLPFDPELEDPAATPNDIWHAAWTTNVMAHVYAARAVLPSMLRRGDGYLLNTASAAGLLTMIGSSSYATTKHAAIGLAESFAIAYRDRGVRVSVLAPLAVATPMTNGKRSFGADMNGILSSEAVAEAAVLGLEEERFLILPHPEVASHVAKKAGDHQRWLRHMTSFRRAFV